MPGIMNLTSHSPSVAGRDEVGACLDRSGMIGYVFRAALHTFDSDRAGGALMRANMKSRTRRVDDLRLARAFWSTVVPFAIAGENRVRSCPRAARHVDVRDLNRRTDASRYPAR